MPKPALDLPLPSRFPDRPLQRRGPSLLLPYRRVSQCWGVFRLPQVEPCPKTWPISAPVNPRVSVDCGFLSMGGWIGVEQLNMRWIKTGFYVTLSTGHYCVLSFTVWTGSPSPLHPSFKTVWSANRHSPLQSWMEGSFFERNQGQTVIVRKFFNR